MSDNELPILEASTAAKAARDEVLMAVEFAQYALEDYAHRPAIAALLDALTAYQAARTAREAAGVALRLDRLAEAQRDAYDEREAL